MAIKMASVLLGLLLGRAHAWWPAEAAATLLDCRDGALFASVDAETEATEACRTGGLRRLDEYTATTSISNYSQTFTLDNGDGNVDAVMNVTWGITNGSAAWGYKSIKDPWTGEDVQNLAVIDSATGATLTFGEYKNENGWTVVKFYFSASLEAGDKASVSVSYTIPSATKCVDGKEAFSFWWSNWWRSPVVGSIVYTMTVRPPVDGTDGACVQRGLSISPLPTSRAAAAPTVREGGPCNSTTLSQIYFSNDLDISVGDPARSTFAIGPPVKGNICDQEGMSTAAILIIIGFGVAIAALGCLCCALNSMKNTTPSGRSRLEESGRERRSRDSDATQFERQFIHGAVIAPVAEATAVQQELVATAVVIKVGAPDSAGSAVLATKVGVI